jgi:hypothetical protein
MYSDPAVSLVITCIIFSSALPLSELFSSLQRSLDADPPFPLAAKSASFILLQGVPSSIPLDRLRSAIAAIPGVHNVHGELASRHLPWRGLIALPSLAELHVWSLSESKSVASVHVMTNEGDFVEVSSKIRRVMHRFGIHSSSVNLFSVASCRLANVPALLQHHSTRDRYFQEPRRKSYLGRGSSGGHARAGGLHGPLRRRFVSRELVLPSK